MPEYHSLKKGFAIFRSPEIARKLRHQLVVKLYKERIKVILFQNPTNTIGIFQL